MDRNSFEKLHKLITQMVRGETERNVSLTPEEKKLLESVRPDIERFAKFEVKEEDAANWSMGALIRNSIDNQWTLGFCSIPMIRHSGTNSGEEWTLTFSSIPMIRHRRSAT